MDMAVPFELASDGPVELLPLALSRPNEALERARAVLAGEPGLLEASIARQAIGIVLREFGDIDAAVRELRLARRLARRAGPSTGEADVLATLGVALVFAGRTRLGRNTLDAAVRQSTGPFARQDAVALWFLSAEPGALWRGARGREQRGNGAADGR